MGEEAFAFPPWLDLPEPLVELVLERLPLVDYIRFAAVCLKWRSIQGGHRLRYAPHPPPMANQLPWLVPFQLNDPRQMMECYSPSDRKSYRLPVPGSLHNSRCLASCRGWLLLLDHIDLHTSNHPFIFNPITAALIPLPSLPLAAWRPPVGAMSTPPTDPDCIVLLVVGCRALLYRPNDHCVAGWTIIQLAEGSEFQSSAIYCQGKFYHSRNNANELHVIDPSLQKVVSRFVMRCPYRTSNGVFLQELGGELFLVQTLWGSGVKQFQVFKADLSEHKWVRVETLGDHTLFYNYDCSIFLLADDVGCKRNSIYACKEIRCDGWIGRCGRIGHDVFTCGVFDLGSGSWTEEDTLTDIFLGAWLLPALDSVNPAKDMD